VGWRTVVEATNLIGIPIVVFVQSIAVIVVIKFIIIPVIALPAFEAFTLLRIHTCLAWCTHGEAGAASLLIRVTLCWSGILPCH
jgi:hypothetical protein